MVVSELTKSRGAIVPTPIWSNVLDKKYTDFLKKVQTVSRDECT